MIEKVTRCTEIRFRANPEHYHRKHEITAERYEPAPDPTHEKAPRCADEYPAVRNLVPIEILAQEPERLSAFGIERYVDRRQRRDHERERNDWKKLAFEKTPQEQVDLGKLCDQ